LENEANKKKDIPYLVDMEYLKNSRDNYKDIPYLVDMEYLS
jgi:hypothetical protein